MLFSNARPTSRLAIVDEKKQKIISFLEKNIQTLKKSNTNAPNYN